LLLGGGAVYLRKRGAAAKTEASHHKALADASAAANHAKSAFLANMSHELRSPLNAMLGFTRLLMRDSRLFAEGKEDLATVLKSGEHLYVLINQVLDLSKIEAGRMTLTETNFDLQTMLDDLAGMFSIVAKQKGLRLIVERAPDTPRYVRTDAMKLRQVLINLLSNAFKFTSKGAVTLRIDMAGEGAPIGRLSIAVIDTGEGIAAEELSRLGGAFVQAQAGRRVKEGTGLGLAISRNFVALMGGELTLSSKPGKGTVVTFEIPAPAVDAEQATSDISPRGSRVVGIVAGQPRYRILAVDDRAEGRQLLTRLLAPLGFDVREASNGEEAAAIWAAWRPHLIWMDMRMPVMDGREATQRIKAQPGGKETIIIALTASSFEEEREQILAVGCDDFMRKPFREDMLFEMMRKHLKVNFIYEEESADASPAPPDAAMFARLPAELRAPLEEALKRLDIDAIADAIESIRARDTALADALAGLAKRFQYAQILNLVTEEK
jgi:CheY-like chemotaxis protein/nitrogen-specific signal transduction histidine kinase